VKVLLTGGTGFLGKNVARALAARGHAVRVLARAGSNLAGLPEGVDVARGDVTDAGSLRLAAEGCAAVLHMAALVKMWVPDRSRFDAVNLGGLRTALEAARAAGARLLYTSSFIALGPTGSRPVERPHPSASYRNDPADQGAGRRRGREAAAAGQDVVMLYPGVVYGPSDLTDRNLVVKMIADHMGGRFPGIIGPATASGRTPSSRTWPKGHASPGEGQEGEALLPLRRTWYDRPLRDAPRRRG
jgi:farnesol dehydrogenase